MTKLRLPGLVPYVAILLWFLLAVMAPLRAAAPEGPVALAASDLLPAIEAALMETGIAAGAEIVLAEPSAPVYIAPGAAPVFDSVSVNPHTGRFLIRATGPGGAPASSIAGFARTPARFPVLDRPLARGETVSDDMIDWIETADFRSRGFLTDAEDLIGMKARRALAAGEPLRVIDVEAPLLVRKGALVTMTYADLGITLSEQGLAQSHGAKDEVIEVKNVKSDRVIKAVVRGAGLVAVAGSRPAPMSTERSR